MDPIKSWLDSKEVRRMAEGLMAPPPEVDPSVLDAGYGDTFEGFAASSKDEKPSHQRTPSEATPGDLPEQEASRQQAMVENSLVKAKHMAESSGMLGSQPVEQRAPVAQAQPNLPQQPSVPSFGRGVYQKSTGHGSRGPFLERLKRFSDYVSREFGARAMFLIDNDGQVIMDEVENPKLIQMARTLANASYTASRQSAGSAAVGNLHVKIGPNMMLEVMPVHSRYGLLILGVIFPAALGSEKVGQLMKLLMEAVDPSE